MLTYYIKTSQLTLWVKWWWCICRFKPISLICGAKIKRFLTRQNLISSTFFKNTHKRVLSRSNIHIIIVPVFHRILDFKNGAGFLSWLHFYLDTRCWILDTRWKVPLATSYFPLTIYGTTTVFVWIECALKYPKAPPEILVTALAGEADWLFPVALWLRLNQNL